MVGTKPSQHGEWVIPQWEFADTLRKVRLMVEMDQKQFAEAIGVTAASLAGWESGRSRPRDVVSIAKRIELLTRVPASWVLALDMNLPSPDGDGAAESPLSGLNRRPSAYKDVVARIGAGQRLVIPMPGQDDNVIPLVRPAAIPLAGVLAPVVSLRPRTTVRTADKRVVFAAFESAVA